MTSHSQTENHETQAIRSGVVRAQAARSRRLLWRTRAQGNQSVLRPRRRTEKCWRRGLRLCAGGDVRNAFAETLLLMADWTR